jgi:hypothetical protein
VAAVTETNRTVRYRAILLGARSSGCSPAVPSAFEAKLGRWLFGALLRCSWGPRASRTWLASIVLAELR